MRRHKHEPQEENLIIIPLLIEDKEHERVDLSMVEGFNLWVWTQDRRKNLEFSAAEVKEDSDGYFLAVSEAIMSMLAPGVIVYRYRYTQEGHKFEHTVVTEQKWAPVGWEAHPALPVESYRSFNALRKTVEEYKKIAEAGIEGALSKEDLQELETYVETHKGEYAALSGKVEEKADKTAVAEQIGAASSTLSQQITTAVSGLELRLGADEERIEDIEEKLEGLGDVEGSQGGRVLDVDLDIDGSQQAGAGVMVFKARQSKEELKAIYNAINNDLSGCRLRVKANLDSDNYWMFTFPTAVRSVSSDSTYLTLDYFVSESNISAHCALMPDGSAVFTLAADQYVRKEDYEKEAAKRAFIPLWNDACITRYQGHVITYGRYNEATGYFELNGIKDLTFEQALRIYNAGRIHGSKDSIINAESFYVGCDIRTNLPPVPFSGTGTSPITLNNTFRASLIEVATCINATIGTFAFSFCYNLRQIGTKEAPMGDINTCGKLDNAKLEIVYGKLSANHDLDVSACPLLTLENFQYWVQNASNTAVITIKVHSDVYAKLTGEDPEWQQVLQTASQKNISFAA